MTARYAAEHPDWELAFGECGPGPWVKAVAVEAAIAQTTAETLVVADADVWVDNLREAVGVLAAGAPWVIPHRLVHRLSPAATAAVLAGADPVEASTQGYDQRPYDGWAGGGVVVLRRDDYARAPLDPRFRNWGSEDASWALCLRALVGHETRLGADLWHLWHPPQQRLTRVVGSREGEALWLAYRMARRRPDRMLRLVDEGRRR